LHVNVRRHAKVPVTKAPAVRVHGVELALAAQAPLLGMSELLPRGRDEDQGRELRV
jgi:type VI protein secretion system component VasF